MQVVKSDSKGRVSVGYKDCRFKMHKLGGTLVLELENNPMAFLSYPAPKEALQYLERFGINPSTVHAESSDDAGYDAFELDDEGKPIREYGRRKRTRKPWPEGFNWPQFVKLSVGIDI